MDSEHGLQGAWQQLRHQPLIGGRTMPAGRMPLPLHSMAHGAVVVPVVFTTDAAGAVVDFNSPGNACTVIKVPATTGQYRILLGRSDTLPDRYKSLLLSQQSI